VVWSIADYLGSLEKGVDELLKETDKPKPKPEDKVEPKSEAKAKPKPETKAKSKPEAKAEPKPEDPKPEVKSQ